MSNIDCCLLAIYYNRCPYRPDGHDQCVWLVNTHLEESRNTSTTGGNDLVRPSWDTLQNPNPSTCAWEQNFFVHCLCSYCMLTAWHTTLTPVSYTSLPEQVINDLKLHLSWDLGLRVFNMTRESIGNRIIDRFKELGMFLFMKKIIIDDHNK